MIFAQRKIKTQSVPTAADRMQGVITREYGREEEPETENYDSMETAGFSEATEPEQRCFLRSRFHGIDRQLRNSHPRRSIDNERERERLLQIRRQRLQEHDQPPDLPMTVSPVISLLSPLSNMVWADP